MNIEKIKIGDKAPDEFNVIIEIPQNSDPIKYEFDKESGAIIVDRFVATAMHYPCSYGFIPGTMSNDGDPADVLVLSEFPILVGAVIKVRPIGVLMMEDESGMDEKILAVPVAKLTSYYDSVKSFDDLPPLLLARIKNFFENYKALEKGKWVKVQGWEGPEKAKEIVRIAMENK